MASRIMTLLFCLQSLFLTAQVADFDSESTCKMLESEMAAARQL